MTVSDKTHRDELLTLALDGAPASPATADLKATRDLGVGRLPILPLDPVGGHLLLVELMARPEPPFIEGEVLAVAHLPVELGELLRPDLSDAVPERKSLLTAARPRLPLAG
jgi:hypothetical protein